MKTSNSEFDAFDKAFKKTLSMSREHLKKA